MDAQFMQHSASDIEFVGGFDAMKGAQQNQGGFLKNFLGGKESPADAGKKSASSMPKKLMDMIGFLGNSPKGSKEAEAAVNAAGADGVCNARISQNSGLSEYVNKMSISESPGKRSKLSNDSQASACSSMSIGSAGSNVSMSPAAPASPAPTQHAGLNPNAYTSNLDRLLEAARYCQLPQNGRPVQPMPADPFSNPHHGPTVLLTVAASIPPRMQRQHWCLSDYNIGEKLYTGYASTVYKAVCKRTNEVVVLKIYHLLSVCDLYKYQIYREVKVHSALQHENIVHLLASFQEGDKVVMVQEYADGADLFTLLHKYGGRLSERLAVQMVLDPFLRVLQYLHSRAIIHRDIKPENIMFNKAMTLKLGDFGLAIDLREERAVTRAGTLDYMAPEVLRCPFKSRPEENKSNERLHYSARVDAWAVGVLTYELLVGFPPFFDQSRTNTEERIMASLPQFPANISEEAKSFITSALLKNPMERPTVLEMLHHPWIESYRTRRSMRQVPVPAQVTPRRPAPAASASAGHMTTAPGVSTPIAAAPGSSKPSPMQMSPPAAAAATGHGIGQLAPQNLSSLLQSASDKPGFNVPASPNTPLAMKTSDDFGQFAAAPGASVSRFSNSHSNSSANSGFSY